MKSYGPISFELYLVAIPCVGKLNFDGCWVKEVFPGLYTGKCFVPRTPDMQKNEHPLKGFVRNYLNHEPSTYTIFVRNLLTLNVLKFLNFTRFLVKEVF